MKAFIQSLGQEWRRKHLALFDENYLWKVAKSLPSEANSDLLWPPIPGDGLPYWDAVQGMSSGLRKKRLKIQDPENGNTALHYGVLVHNESVVFDLLELCDGEDVIRPNHEGWSPWMLALDIAEKKLAEGISSHTAYPILRSIHDRYHVQSQSLALAPMHIVDMYRKELEEFRALQTKKELVQTTSSGTLNRVKSRL
jgi:hypothetical protein